MSTSHGSSLKPLVLAALLLAGCAQPAPLIPQPPGPGPVAATAPAAPSEPRPTASGDVRLVGERKERACGACWSFSEVLAAVTAAVLFAWGLIRLYRRKSGKN